MGVEAAVEAVRLRSHYKPAYSNAILLAATKGSGAMTLLADDRGFLKVRAGIETVVLDDFLKEK